MHGFVGCTTRLSSEEPLGVVPWSPHPTIITSQYSLTLPSSPAAPVPQASLQSPPSITQLLTHTHGGLCTHHVGVGMLPAISAPRGGKGSGLVTAYRKLIPGASAALDEVEVVWKEGKDDVRERKKKGGCDEGC